MDFMSIVSKMISLFLIMAVGYIMNKAKIIDEVANARFTKMVLNITVPAQAITAFISARGEVSNGEIITGFGMTIAAYVAYLILAVLLIFVLRIPKEQKGTYAYMTLFSNVGFMGYPVITAVFGQHAMIYAVIVNVVFNIIVFSAGVLLISGGSREVNLDVKKLLNIPMAASLLSVVFYFTGVSFPEPVMASLEYLGDVTTPVAMLVLGSSIASMPVKELFGDWRIYIFTAYRLLIIPLVIFVILQFVPVGSELMRGTLLVLSAMPVATNTTMMAIEYEGDLPLASKGIFFSTILSVVTIPFIAMLC